MRHILVHSFAYSVSSQQVQIGRHRMLQNVCVFFSYWAGKHPDSGTCPAAAAGPGQAASLLPDTCWEVYLHSKPVYATCFIDHPYIQDSEGQLSKTSHKLLPYSMTLHP